MKPWNLVFLTGLLVYFGIRHVFMRRTSIANPSTFRQLDGLERALLGIVTVGTMLLPVLYLATPWLAFADCTLPPAAPWCGAALMVAGLWLFYRAHADLGRNWSVTLELRERHQLITGGVYRCIRHPMYASIFLFSVAQGLLLTNWLAGWGALLTFAVLYLIRTPREERMMCEAFGDQYRAYMRHTGRLWPRLMTPRGG
jgi:protein-S-isoprenylcysteine O-methyltransferase Ste14